MEIKRIYYIFIAFSDLFVIAVLLFHTTILKILSTLTPQCPSYALAGIKCSMCGGTRAFKSLISGNIVRSLQFNWFAVILMITVIIVLLIFNIWVMTKSKFLYQYFVKKIISIPTAIVVLTLMVLHFVLENAYNLFLNI